MKIKALVAGLAATALASLGVLAVAAPASAHTPSVSATCSTLTVSLTNYAGQVEGKPATDPVTHEVPHHDLVTPEVPGTPGTPAIPGKDAVPAVTQVQYLWQKSYGHDTKWSATSPGAGWSKVHPTQSKTVEISPAIPAVPGVPAVPGTDPIPAVYHDWTETIVDQPGTPAVEAKTNHVTVTIDGTVQADLDFGSTYVHEFDLGNQYTEHTYHVVATAWDDSRYNVDESGTTTACAVPVVSANPHATVTATCGQAVVDLTNPQNENEQNKTAAFTIWVDGEFKEAVAVTGDASEQRTYTFAEDSGDHQVVVKNAESEGGATLAEATVSSDCTPNIPPQPEAKVTYGDWVDGVYVCGDTTVMQTRTVTTTPYVLIEGAWVLDIEHSDKSVQKQERDLTAAEIKALDCPVVVVPPTKPPVVVTPPVKPAPAAPAVVKAAPVADDSGKLADTGSDISFAAGLVGAALLLSGAIIGVVIARRRRSADDQA